VVTNSSAGATAVSTLGATAGGAAAPGLTGIAITVGYDSTKTVGQDIKGAIVKLYGANACTKGLCTVDITANGEVTAG
jgi:hypothetical protein